jgi:hypothetical protein
MADAYPGVRVIRGADISECGRYRYRLWREWRDTLPLGQRDRGNVLWIALNPSTADAHEDDATLRRMLAFSQRAAFGALYVCNLFAVRSTDPRAITSPGAVGPDNNAFLRAESEAADSIVAAWGADLNARARASEVAALLGEFAHKTYCLGRTKDGAPRHPLYVRGDAELSPWP